MEQIRSQTIRPQEAGAPRVVWSAVATAVLVGIALVSLIDVFAIDSSEQTPIPVPPESHGEDILIIAPGGEHRLLPLAAAPFELWPAWEVLPERPSPYWVGLLNASLPRVPRDWTKAEPLRLGGWEWTRITPAETAAVTNRYELSDHLGEAQVFFRWPDGAVQECNRWRFGRWNCGLEDWLWVGNTEVPIRGQNRECIWAHPRRDSVLVIRFSNVTTGTRLSGRYGFSDVAADDANTGPVQFTVRVNDTQREFTAESRRGLFSYHIVPSSDAQSQVDVEFLISAESDGRSHFCFTGAMAGLDSWEVEDSTPPPDSVDGQNEEPPAAIPRQIGVDPLSDPIPQFEGRIRSVDAIEGTIP